MDVGLVDGDLVGVIDGVIEGEIDGNFEGESVLSLTLGLKLFDGCPLGPSVTPPLGTLLSLGLPDGTPLGPSVGTTHSISEKHIQLLLPTPLSTSK